VLIADNVAIYANSVFDAASHGTQLSCLTTWIGVVSFTLQLYFDFSGYSDMAIGLSRLFGIQLPINFNSPYKARSIIDFWRRWHITLSQFLQQYLYIPLGGNRDGKFKRYVNLMVTMLLGGLWHGANWTFVVWGGGLHGIFLMINHAWRAIAGDRLPSNFLSPRTIEMIKMLLTFFCTMFAWIFFRSDSLATARIVLNGCLGADGGVVFFPDASYGLVDVSCETILSGGLAIAWLAPNTQEIMGYAKSVALNSKSTTSKLSWRPSPVIGFSLGCLFCLVLSKLDKISPFLYYQF